jgi:DNA-binding GntR family transcriptional regulator
MIIDPDSPEHPYLQLASYLRQRIRDGDLTSKLPSLTALTEETGLALNTVQRAVRVLKDEGLVYTVPGRGVFVSKDPRRP